nr:transaldolase family protein [Klebsiella variicola]
MNQLEQLKQRTTIVADSGDIDSIMAYQPEDATTNPSLIYKAAQLPQYQKLVKDAVAAVKSRQNGKPVQPADIADYLAVSIGVLILKNVPGRISTGTVAKLAMRQPFVLFKGLTFQKLCLPGAFRPGDHHNKMLRPGLCVVHASPQYL